MVEGLEETRTQLVMVTEAVFCSVGNLLTGFQGLPDKVLLRACMYPAGGVLAHAQGLHTAILCGTSCIVCVCVGVCVCVSEQVSDKDLPMQIMAGCSDLKAGAQ